MKLQLLYRRTVGRVLRRSGYITWRNARLPFNLQMATVNVPLDVGDVEFHVHRVAVQSGVTERLPWSSNPTYGGRID